MPPSGWGLVEARFLPLPAQPADGWGTGGRPSPERETEPDRVGRGARSSAVGQTRLAAAPQAAMPSPVPMLLFILLLAGMTSAFRICAFNAQRLTVAKLAKIHIMETIVKILARCDIMVLQEVVDTSGDAIPLLLRDLNRFDDSGPYSSLSSPLLGRSTYMEKYVYVYRSHKTQVLNAYVYDDKMDVFAREPFVAQFSLPSKVLPKLALVPLHTTPKDVTTELDALYLVFLNVSQHWQNENVILLGDFNADCSSLSKKRQGELMLRTKPGFHWVIPDGEDTTVRESTHCTYDRSVLLPGPGELWFMERSAKGW
ncbi:deoxyribonuclease-1-like 1 isoform X2 [Petaurus breviceps papuanus]|uniref:deoxyribonuclease-1-like 1 isoform X2 n=1 Tax=Petaurus breviceps papuanus TaxID=3040969 RepID=UPI0036D8DFE8